MSKQSHTTSISTRERGGRSGMIGQCRILPFPFPTALISYSQRRNTQTDTQTPVNQQARELVQAAAAKSCNAASLFAQRLSPFSFFLFVVAWSVLPPTPLPPTARMHARTGVMPFIPSFCPAVLRMSGLLFPAPKMTQTQDLLPSSSPPSLPPHSLPTHTTQARTLCTGAQSVPVRWSGRASLCS